MSSPEPKNPRVLLLEDHRRIDRLLDRLITTVRADDRDASAQIWGKTETALLKHLDVEEMFVLPALRTEHAAEVERLRRDHDALRKETGELGLSVELHTLRCDAVESFCARLREHAEREDSLAYVQAGRALSISVARSIASRLERGLGLRRKSSMSPARSAT